VNLGPYCEICDLGGQAYACQKNYKSGRKEGVYDGLEGGTAKGGEGSNPNYWIEFKKYMGAKSANKWHLHKSQISFLHHSMLLEFSILACLLVSLNLASFLMAFQEAKLTWRLKVEALFKRWFLKWWPFFNPKEK
jgi:hypothetical protein